MCAFAPGLVDGTASPGEPGNTVLAGHRDTVFAFLGRLRLGDQLDLESADGARRSHTVTATHVVDEHDTRSSTPPPNRPSPW